MEFFATCGYGLEQALGDELKAAGVHGVRPLGAGVSFSGDVEDAYRACLHSRIASRVLLTLGRIAANDADALYEGVKALPWEDHIGPEATIAIDARGTNDALHDTRFTALRTKDALCDRLRDLRGERPNVDSARPDVRVNVVINRNRATISIDLSGDSLDKRGYRANAKPQGAPIRENLAAAMLVKADWPRRAAEGAGLMNLESGPGTIAVEAAMMAAGIAPGLRRAHWGFEGWAGHDQAVWERLLDAADDAAERGMESCTTRIIAVDEDEAALEYARACAKKAGVANLITFCADADAWQLGEGPGLLACNLSGASQFDSLAQMPAFYAGMRSRVADNPGIDAVALLSAPESMTSLLGADPVVSLEVRNGAADAELQIFAAASITAAGSTTVEVRGTQVAVADAGAEQFASRLVKVARLRRKWAAKNNVSAYRVYDADLPEYNLAIDIYNGAGPDTGRTLVHVAEYAAPKKIDPAKTARRLCDALAVIPAALDVDPADVFVKQRLRARGGSQYSKGAALGDAQGTRFITQENGLLFEVNLADRLDTGLFLDHRDTRLLVSKLAKDKSFLNLFAYTGTASVYAAAGGAKFTTTVDMSNTYQEWTRRNFELNNLADRHMELERADVLAWVQEKRRTRMRWDLVFVDPPTFSNSSKMGKRSWDVQEDHAELLIGVSRLLTRTGAIVFSCNLRDFKLDTEKLAKAGVVAAEITDKTIPEDFERNGKIHHAYVLRRG